MAVVLLALSCGGNTGHSLSPSAAGATASPAATPSGGAGFTSYGLLLTAGTLEMITPAATIAAHAKVAAPSVQFCSAAHDRAVQPPPVSASDHHVYFRDGDTQIRMVVPPSGTADVTKVPGGGNVVSFFSVSPDDQRIAVLVEDVSSTTAVSERLYVEDLHGGGHHLDIFSTQVPKDERGKTLWPMGWHNGALVLAVMPACTFVPIGILPSAWHISSATTGRRVATITANNCWLSLFPSSHGVGCINGTNGSTVEFDLSGKKVAVTGPPTPVGGYALTGLSPAGQSMFFATGEFVDGPPLTTQILQLGPGPYATVQGHAACAWIDEDHLLAPDAVIQFPAETPGNVKVRATATALPAGGECAGRFPGGL